MHRDLWTNEDIEVLRVDVEDGVHSEITAAKLGRTAPAVFEKAVSCGFLGPMSKRQVAELRRRWKAKMPAMRAAIREAVAQSA